MTFATTTRRSVKWIVSLLPHPIEAVILDALRRTFSRNSGAERDRAEARRILRCLRGRRAKKPARVLIVYDNAVSPPTYGDFLLVVMLARYFGAAGFAVEFCVVDSEFRSAWNRLSENERDHFLREQLNLAATLLSPFRATVKRLSWMDMKAQLDSLPADSLVLFRDRVIARLPVYDSAFNLTNLLMGHGSDLTRSDFFLSFPELSRHVEVKRPNGPYVAWHCRLSTMGDDIRNTGDEEFIRIYNDLRARFPGRAIMVVSDARGCDYFKRLAR